MSDHLNERIFYYALRDIGSYIFLDIAQICDASRSIKGRIQ